MNKVYAPNKGVGHKLYWYINCAEWAWHQEGFKTETYVGVFQNGLVHLSKPFL